MKGGLWTGTTASRTHSAPFSSRPTTVSTAACNQSLGCVLLKTPMLALCSPGPVFTGRPILGDDGQLDAESQKRVDESGWDGLGGNGAYEETRPRRIAREGWRKASKL